MEAMKFLEHKIPPPAVGLGIGVLMWYLASLVPPLDVSYGVRLGIAPALLGVPLFVLYMNRFQIAPEERVMASLFGADYAAYKEKVRGWI